MTAAPGVAQPPAGGGAAATVGVEEEFLLLWPDGDAACIAPDLLAALPAGVPAQHEFAQYQVETTTGVCTELADVGRELSVARRTLAGAAADHGARLVASGTPPCGAPGLAGLTDDPRYRRLVAALPGIAAEEVTCACHVHVGLPDRDLGAAVLGRLRPWLPALLALTGNSPLWRGRDTGWSSYRFVVQRQWPTFLPPPRCTGAADYDDRVAALVASSAAFDERSVYFLARLSPRWPTVEIRVADSCPTVADAVLLAGLCRALVATAVADEAAGRPVPDVPDRVLVACCCAAARRGLGALVASPDRDRLAPAREVLGELVLAVTPALAAAGDDRVVRDLLADRLRRGSGAEQQRALWRSSPRDVVVQTLAALSAELQPGVW